MVREKEREQKTEMIIAGAVWLLKHVGKNRVKA